MKCGGKIVLFFCLVLAGGTSLAADVPQLNADIGRAGLISP